MLYFAFALLVLTLLQHYGYYFVDGVPARVFYALSGIQSTAVTATMLYLLFRKIQDWRVVIVLLITAIIALAENLMIAVCGSWYAFVYSGARIDGDKCEVMLNTVISKPIAYALITFGAIFLPLMWNKRHVPKR